MARVLSSGSDASIPQHMGGEIAMHESLIRSQISSPLMGDPGDRAWESFSHTQPQVTDDRGTTLMELLSEIQATSPESYEKIYILATRVYSTLTEHTGPFRVYELFGEQGGFLIVGQLLAAIQRGRDITDKNTCTWLSRLLLLTLQILTDAITWSRHNLHSFERLLGWDSLVATLMEAVPSSMPSRTIAMLFGLALGQVTTGIEQFKLVSEAVRAGQTPTREAHQLSIVHPAAIYAAVSLADEVQIQPNIREATYTLLHEILVTNERNTSVLSRTRVPSLLLRAWLTGRRHSTESSVLRLLWQDGIKHAEDVRTIFSHLMHSSLDDECELLGLLHDISISAHRPASLTMASEAAPSDHGATGIHIRALPRPFPSDDPTSAGFSLSMLLRIEKTTSDASLVLFRLESAPAYPMRLILDMTLGTLMYDPGGTTQQAFRLPRTQLEQGAWHSVVLTHARSMPRVASTVHVYLDGKRVCTLQAPWPGAFATPASVWLGGTPVVGEGHATWSLSSVFLMDGLIPPSIPALLHELVPSYTGNLQAPLARFLSYAGLTRMHTRLKELAGASEPRGQSHSFRALKSALHMAAADIFPLEHFYLHLQADHTLRCGTQVLVPNQALPHLLKNIGPSEGHGRVMGLPTLRLPRRLDESVWSLGGCALLLRLVELSNSTASLEACVSLFLRLVSFSWRLAEDAERIRAFGILGALLRARTRMITTPIFAALQEAAAPATSWANVQLYRSVLLDTDLWVCTSEAVQLAYAQHFQQLLPLGGRGLADVHLVRLLIHYSMRASCVPLNVLDQAMQAALEGHFRARNIQALVQFVAVQLGHVAPNAASLGAAQARSDESMFFAPMEASQDMVPAPTTQDPRGCELARLWLATFLRLLAVDEAHVKVAADAVQVKWLMVLLRPGLLPLDAELVVPLAQQLLSASPNLAHAFTRMGGFRVLEATLPTLWYVPPVFSWLWTLCLGPRKRAISLFDTFSTLDRSPLHFPQALRVLVQCIGTGLQDCRPIQCQRRASVPMVSPDVTKLRLLKESVSLLVFHAVEPKFYTILMLAPTLVCILRATAPRYMDAPCGETVAILCDDLTGMLAHLMAHITLQSHTLTLLHNMHGAMPTPDPLVQSRLCVAIYIPLLEELMRLLQTRPLGRPSLDLVADILELTSNESMRDSLLQQRIFELADVLIGAPARILSPRARSQASVALERNILHGLSNPKTLPDVLRFCERAKYFILTENADDTFKRITFYHSYMHHVSDPHAALCLEHIRTCWPDLVLDNDTDLAAYSAVWEDTLASQRSFLHRLTHERWCQRQCKPSSRAMAVLVVHKRLSAWHDALVENNTLRTARYAQDTREDITYLLRTWYDLRQSNQLTDLKARTWQLDPTEGPCRARIKLWSVPEHCPSDPLRLSRSPSPPIHTSEQDAKLLPEEFDVGVAPQEEAPVQIASSLQNIPRDEAEEPAEPAEDYEDKIRWILRTLHPRDTVEGVFNTTRVVGVDVQPSLLLIGTHHLYLLDNFFSRPNGEIVNFADAPHEERDVLILAAGVALLPDVDEPVRVWRWDMLKHYLRRAWLHRRTALELFFTDGQSSLLVLPSYEHISRLSDLIRLKMPLAHTASEALIESVTDVATNSTRLPLRRHMGRATVAWQERRISNAEYLMILNTLAGRTMNDLAQFPVFPWVLADYDSTDLDLERASTFRQLDKPMGAQQAERRAQFIERYEQLHQVQMEPFHYGTHYSTATSVCAFLIRVQPFSNILKELQGGTFDLPDRLFASVRDTWISASERSCADVRELIPEFYFLPEMFTNTNHFAFGTTQAGKDVDDVELPPWAHGDPFLFVQKHREALESDYVSAHLHEWIDLIFGYKARGGDAVAFTNVFHPMSYSHAIDLEGIDSLLERQAAAQVVHNFGQTPAQLFTRPHPSRLSRKPLEPWKADADMLQYPYLLLQSRAPVAYVPGLVYRIDGPPDSLYASTRECVLLPEAQFTLSYGYMDNSMRFLRLDGQPVAMLEHAAVGRITCMEALPHMVVFGSDDGMMHMYSLNLLNPHLEIQAALDGHTAAVISMATSTSWSIVVTGSKDHTVIVWDLNRRRVVRQLEGPDQAVEHLAIDDKKGWIAAATGSSVWIWSINGVLLVQQSTRSATYDPLSSMTFISRDFHVGKLGVLATGHRDLIVLWNIVSQHERATAPRWRLSKLAMLCMRDQEGVSITALRASSSSLLSAGDSCGRLYTWNLPGAAVPLAISDDMCYGGCQRRFGFLDKKRPCQGCGGWVCQRCSSNYVGGQLRLCLNCAGFLGSRGMSL